MSIVNLSITKNRIDQVLKYIKAQKVKIFIESKTIGELNELINIYSKVPNRVSEDRNYLSKIDDSECYKRYFYYFLNVYEFEPCFYDWCKDIFVAGIIRNLVHKKRYKVLKFMCKNGCFDKKLNYFDDDEKHLNILRGSLLFGDYRTSKIIYNCVGREFFEEDYNGKLSLELLILTQFTFEDILKSIRKFNLKKDRVLNYFTDDGIIPTDTKIEKYQQKIIFNIFNGK